MKRINTSIAMSGLGLLLAACGVSSTSSNGVVTLDHPGASGGAGASAAPSSSGNRDVQLLAYAQCMRGHGISDFPDPVTDGHGGVSLPLNGPQGPRLDLSSATFQAAEGACQSLLPAGYNDNGNSAGADQAFLEMLAWSQCMRDNGVPGFPDPQRGANGAIQMDRTGIDPATPAFEAAQQTCQSRLPGGGPHITIGGAK